MGEGARGAGEGHGVAYPRDDPLTWEQRASQANYAALTVLDRAYVEARLSAPHTWHAAEVFLYVLGFSRPPE